MIRPSFESSGIAITPEQEKLFEKFLALFQEWNGKISLSGIREPKEIVIKHFVDSCMLGKVYDMRRAHHVLDVGTGGGLPGIALAILYPHIAFTLLDATRKKLLAVEDMVEKLGLKNVNVLWGRAEDVCKQQEVHESFDLVTARALAPLPTLLHWCLPFVRAEGHLAAYKGPAAEAELKEAAPVLEKLKAVYETSHEYDLPEQMGHHTILLFRKIARTKRFVE